jgi:hypothetical protein
MKNIRSTRNQPFCWQEKKIFRLLRREYSGTQLVKMRCLYDTITEIDSDFNGRDISYYTKTIHTYSGLSKEWIPSGLKILEQLGIIQIIEDRDNGKWKGKRLQFTPENVKELPRKPDQEKYGNGKNINGKTEPSEDSLYKEDSIFKEDKNSAPTEKKELTEGAKVNAFIKDFCERYKKESGGHKATIDGKSIGMIKGLLKRHSLKSVKAALKKFYENDFWFTKNGGRSLAGFIRNYDEIVTSQGTKRKQQKKPAEDIDPQEAYDRYMRGEK